MLQKHFKKCFIRVILYGSTYIIKHYRKNIFKNPFRNINKMLYNMLYIHFFRNVTEKPQIINSNYFENVLCYLGTSFKQQYGQYGHFGYWTLSIYPNAIKHCKIRKCDAKITPKQVEAKIINRKNYNSNFQHEKFWCFQYTTDQLKSTIELRFMRHRGHMVYKQWYSHDSSWGEKVEIWLGPMTKSATPTENKKKNQVTTRKRHRNVRLHEAIADEKRIFW